MVNSDNNNVEERVETDHADESKSIKRRYVFRSWIDIW